MGVCGGVSGDVCVDVCGMDVHTFFVVLHVVICFVLCSYLFVRGPDALTIYLLSPFHVSETVL